MNTKLKGNISEIKVITKLIEKGYTVSLPFGDNARYDLIFDNGLSLNKVQVKSARFINEGCIEFSTSSSSLHRGGLRKGYKEDVDFFAVYYSNLDEIYLIPISECTNTTMRLRTCESIGKNQYIPKYTKDFVI